MEFLDQLQKYWAILIFIGTVIGSWVRYELKIAALEERMRCIENDTKALEKSQDSFREEIKVDIREIKTTMVFIKEVITELKQK